MAHAHGAYLYTDAIQAVGMFPMNLRETGVDFLASGTYKWLLAGFGVAPFFVCKEHLDRIRPDRRGHLHIEKHTVDLAWKLRKELADLGFRLFTPEGNKTSIVTFLSPRPYEETSKIFVTAKIAVSFRGEDRMQVRVSPALFNNTGDIGRFLRAAARLNVFGKINV